MEVVRTWEGPLLGFGFPEEEAFKTILISIKLFSLTLLMTSLFFNSHYLPPVLSTVLIRSITDCLVKAWYSWNNNKV